MADFRPITRQDDQASLASAAARHAALLSEALEIAKRTAESKPLAIREILATGKVEGLASNLDSKAAGVSFRAEKFKRTWHSLIPWQYLEHTTAEEQAESMIQTVEDNLHMTETNSWPPLSSGTEEQVVAE